MESLAPLAQQFLTAVGPVGFVFAAGWAFSEWKQWQREKAATARQDKLAETLIGIRLAVEAQARAK